MVPDAEQDEPRPRVLLQRGRRALDDAGRRADRAREARAASGSAWRGPRTSRTAASFRVPKAYPVYDSGYRDASARARVRRRPREPPDDRPQRPAPLQQPGPRDADRACSPSATSRSASATTCGASTPTRSTTRKCRQAEAPEAVGRGGGPSAEVFTQDRRRSPSGSPPASRRECCCSWPRSLLVLKGGGGRAQPPSASTSPDTRVTGAGSILGLLYGLAAGFAAGWGFAYARNAAAFVSMVVIHRRAELQRLRRILEYL